MSSAIPQPNGTPQRTVTIALSTNNHITKARYSYVSPVTGLRFQDAPICDLKIDRATNCLFILDYLSTLNGWVIDSISATPGSMLIPSTMGANKLSILTFDPYSSENAVYNFFISYSNHITDTQYSEDPQEGNGPP